MAVVADRVIVELEAKLDRYEANVRRAEAKFDSATRQISQNSRRMARDIERNSAAAGNAIRGLAGTLAAAFSAQQVASLADSYTRFTNQLKVAGLEGENLAGVQSRLFDIGQQYGVQLEGLGTLYSRGAQVANELGASQQQLIQFTTGVAAALKIQGTSAAEAQGALLQLSQLLASGTVRAEEFNSVNEGALPILQAVAKNIDAAGGSVGKLKVLVNDGKISSQQFFQAFLAGTAELEAQSNKATATISQGFTVLFNALSQYVGQTDASLGASERINAALVALSENLDKVATALGILGAVLLGRFVAGMVGAAASTGVVSTAIFAMQARAVGAATSMEALGLASATAGRAMLAAFGGPVGLAVTALTLGIAYFTSTSNDAAEAAEGLRASIEAQANQFTTLEERQARAAAETNRLSAEQRAALTATANLTGEANLLAEAWGRVAAQAKAAAIEQARAAAATAKTNLIQARQGYLDAREEGFQRAAKRPFAERGLGVNAPALNSREALAAAEKAATSERALYERAQRNYELAQQNLKEIEGQSLVTFKPDPATPPAPKPKKGGSGRKGPKGPDPDEIARRFEADVARGEQELAFARAEVIGTLRARNEAERFRIESDRKLNARAIEADDTLSAAQRELLLALNDRIAAEQQAAITAGEQQQAAEDAVALAGGDLANQRDLLEAHGRLATTMGQRREIALRILDLEQQEERLRLEAIIAARDATDAEKEIARRRLAMLDELYNVQREGVEREAEGPLARYKRGLENPDNARDAVEEAIISELQGVRDTITATAQRVLGIKNPTLAAIINNFIEQQVIRPIMDSVSGGGGGGLFGSILSGLGTIFRPTARASGGHVNAGQIYRVNDGGGIEGFQPAGSGKIIPLGRMRTAGGPSVTLHQNVNVDARGSVNPDGYAEHIKAAVRQETLGIVTTAVRGVNKGVPARLAQYQRDGT